MRECNHLVLATVIDFMYGINIPDHLSLEDAKSLLAIADLFKMEDIKAAVAPLIGSQLDMSNIHEISELAKRHNGQRLKELCCDFILADIDQFDLTTLDGSFPVPTVLGKVYLERQKRCLTFANKLLGVDLTQMGHFKKRDEFKSDGDYEGYVKANIKPNMLVTCNRDFYNYISCVKKGTLGRITTIENRYSQPEVKWQGQQNYSSTQAAFLNLDLLTPPITCNKILS